MSQKGYTGNLQLATTLFFLAMGIAKPAPPVSTHLSLGPAEVSRIQGWICPSATCCHASLWDGGIGYGCQTLT